MVIPATAGKQHRGYHRQQVHHVKKHYAKKIHRKKAFKPVVEAVIDVSSQTMSVTINGTAYASWRVSTGRKGYYTPHGSFRVSRMAAVYYSKKYDSSPMPHSVFFSGGNAIHGTTHTGSLGRPASHGCVRLAPGNAATLFNLIREYGAGRTRITVQN